jgi:hypothetical protein
MKKYLLFTILFFCVRGSFANTIAGIVILDGGVPAYPAVVYLGKLIHSPVSACNGWEIIIIDSSYTSPAGQYRFTGVTDTETILRARAFLTPGHPEYKNYLPTYRYYPFMTGLCDAGLVWTCAVPVSFSGANDISMLRSIDTGGSYSLSGSVLTSAGAPVASRLLMITKLGPNASGAWDGRQKPVAYAFTDASGHFSVQDLEAGGYQLHDGSYMIPQVVKFNLLPSIPIHLAVTDDTCATSGIMILTQFSCLPSLNELKIYPNPVGDYINIAGIDKNTGIENISLHDVLGKLVYRHPLPVSGVNEFQISTSKLKPGTYFLKMNSATESATYKIMK